MSAYEISPGNYLSHEYNTYLTHLQELALSQPKVYFTLRRSAEQKIKKEVSTYLFKTIYRILSDARVANLDGSQGDSVWGNTVDPAIFKPSYPAQKINEFSLSAVKTIDEILNDVMEILLPAKITAVLGEKLEKTGRATL